MKFDNLTPGAARECVDHYRMSETDDGAGGWTIQPTLENGSIRVVWEDRTPQSTVEGASLGASLDAEIGLRRSVDMRPDDRVVHQGYVYRVIRQRVRGASRWQIVALQYLPQEEVPGTT